MKSKDNDPKAGVAHTEKELASKLEKFLGGALAKLKNAWMEKSASNGIQFYTESDD